MLYQNYLFKIILIAIIIIPDDTLIRIEFWKTPKGRHVNNVECKNLRYNFALQLKFLSLPRKREEKLVFSYLIRFIGYCSKEGNERGFENQDRIPLDRPNIDEALYGSRTVKFLSVPVIFIAIAVTSNNIFINSLRIVFTWPFGFCTSSSPRLISRINCAAETGDIGGEAQRKRPLPSYFPPKLYTSLYLVSYVFHGATRGDNIAGTNTGNRLPTGLPSQACGFSCHRAAHRFLRQPAGREILSPRREGEEKKSRFFFCPRDIDRSNLNRTLSYAGGDYIQLRWKISY